MSTTHQFKRHYTREEARKLLPQIEVWLGAMDVARAELSKSSPRVEGFLADGCDVGGDLVKRYLQAYVTFRSLLAEFQSRDIQIKDFERGLVDFPAFVEGREVFLCWERGDDDIEHWHELDAGFGGRTPL